MISAAAEPHDLSAHAGYQCDIIGISICSDKETVVLSQKPAVTKFLDQVNLAEKLVRTILELCQDDEPEALNKDQELRVQLYV